MIVASTTYETVLLVLKIAFLVLLYLFVWRIVRTAATRPRALPQESFILTPGARRRRRSARPSHSGPARRRAAARARGGRGVRARLVGRSRSAAAARTTSSIDGDEFASARHVRIEARGDGVWVQDLGSTNGTLRERRAHRSARASSSPGDVVRVGETDLRFEE